jgi:hypothetical protein
MVERRRAATIAVLPVASMLAMAPPARAMDDFQVSGFAALRGTTGAENPLAADSTAAQLQAGLDWSPSPRFLAHVHLLARTDDGNSLDGRFGTPEAYVEAHLPAGRSRLKVKAGAFFLATSRENVDALWENAYTVSSSALNTWLGEELRPIGLDVTWIPGRLLVGATVFAGSDTFGALALDPGWSIHDRWTVLGQEVRTGNDHYASVSANDDGRLGWSARAGWSSPSFSVLYTHIDNRSDGEIHGDLENWATRFDIAGFDYKRGDWTLAAETGWGPTVLYLPDFTVEEELRASYVLVSRRFGRGRATARFDDFRDSETRSQAVTLAAFWTPQPHLTVALELSAGSGEGRGLGDLRYRFAAR